MTARLPDAALAIDASGSFMHAARVAPERTATPARLAAVLFLRGDKGKSMGKTYGEKLRDPQWQRMRLKVMERDGWACQKCGDATSTLHVHHTYYVSGRDPWNYPTGALVVLCESCHDAGPEYYAIGLDSLVSALETHRYKPSGEMLGRLMCARLLTNALCAWIDCAEDGMRPDEQWLQQCEQAISDLRLLTPRAGALENEQQKAERAKGTDA